ncbi:MAG TPA: uroporphyrinogen-III synthase [Phycisphaerae bacterium]|nr:uroporphyrinogen-III synthase [Phycisphaerae bacterium]
MSDLRAWQRMASLVGDFEPGTVSVVGAGPGDAALISVRGAVRLMQADVVVHDPNVAAALLDLVGPQAEVECFPGEGEGREGTSQEGSVPARKARDGKRVVRLLAGDPFVSGRGGRLCAFLAGAQVRFEVVPAVSAALGASATGGIPLVHLGMSRTVGLVADVGGGDDGLALDFSMLAGMDTLVFPATPGEMERYCERLIEAGLDARTPAAVVTRATRPEQKTVLGSVGDIADRLAGEGSDLPAVMIVGPVVRMRESLEWFERQPLHGLTMAVTRMSDQSPVLGAALQAAGAEVIEAPTIQLAEIDDYWPVDQALRGVGQYHWLVVTSANGVDALFKRLEAMGLDARALAGPRIAAVGSATVGRFVERGIRPDLVPGEAVGEALAEALIQRGVAGQRVLLLRSDLARNYVVDALTGIGATCDDLMAYRTVCPESLPAGFLERFDAGEIDWLTLTSPSSVANLVKLLGPERAERLKAIRLASIGPVTTKAIRQAGLTEAVEAHPHDVPGLVAAIVGAVEALPRRPR